MSRQPTVDKFLTAMKTLQKTQEHVLSQQFLLSPKLWCSCNLCCWGFAVVATLFFGALIGISYAHPQAGLIIALVVAALLTLLFCVATAIVAFACTWYVQFCFKK